MAVPVRLVIFLPKTVPKNAKLFLKSVKPEEQNKHKQKFQNSWIEIALCFIYWSIKRQHAHPWQTLPRGARLVAYPACPNFHRIRKRPLGQALSISREHFSESALWKLARFTHRRHQAREHVGAIKIFKMWRNADLMTQNVHLRNVYLITKHDRGNCCDYSFHGSVI